MPNNSTVFLSKNSPPVIIDQGPEWLISFYLSPPPWVNPIIKSIGIIVALVVAYRLYQRDWQIDKKTQIEMQLTVATIVGIIAATLTMVNWFSQPYLVDVTVGFAVGYGGVIVAQKRLLPVEKINVFNTTSERLTVVWSLLAIAAYVLPVIADANGRGMPLSSSRLILVAVSVAMMLYDAIWYNEPD